MKFRVELTYPKHTRAPVYAISITAHGKREAIQAALKLARFDGFKGSPIKTRATLIKEDA